MGPIYTPLEKDLLYYRHQAALHRPTRPGSLYGFWDH